MQVAQATRRFYSWPLMEISVARVALASCRKLDRREYKERHMEEAGVGRVPGANSTSTSFHLWPWET